MDINVRLLSFISDAICSNCVINFESLKSRKLKLLHRIEERKGSDGNFLIGHAIFRV